MLSLISPSISIGEGFVIHEKCFEIIITEIDVQNNEIVNIHKILNYQQAYT